MAKHCRCLLADGYVVGSLCRCSHFVKMSPVGRSFGRSSKLAAKGDGGWMDGWWWWWWKRSIVVLPQPLPLPLKLLKRGEEVDGGGWWAQFNLIERRLCVSLRTDLGDSSGSSY